MDTKWKPGVSGNPGGRPKEVAEIRELAKSHAPEAIATLVKIMKDKTVSPAARATAAGLVLDRGLGRPMQEIKASGEFSYTALLDRVAEMDQPKPEQQEDLPTAH